MIEELPFCECGCGERIKTKGKRFIHGHNKGFLGKTHSQKSKEKMLESLKTTKPKPEPKLCECGCGEYALPGNDYIHGHSGGVEKHSSESIELMSVSHINSATHKANTKNQQGGHDICKHHYIYDHANPEKYTMKVTRSKHSQIHMWMKKAGIVVPHINVTEKNKSIFNR